MKPGYIVPLVGIETTPSAELGVGSEELQTSSMTPSRMSILPSSITSVCDSIVTTLPSRIYSPLWIWSSGG